MTKDKDLFTAGNSESEWDESKHPRDSYGKFTESEKQRETIKKYSDTPDRDMETMGIPFDEVVTIKMDADIQKQFDKATPKERSKLAFRYIMDNLRGKYPTSDKKQVLIERVGAKEMAHTLYEPKIRVLPELGTLIQKGQFMKISQAEHGPFKEFAYYKVFVSIANDTYNAVLNIGIRDNGDSTLYDINQFQKV